MNWTSGSDPPGASTIAQVRRPVNGQVQSFDGKLRDQCLNGELFPSLTEARYLVDRWRLDCNHHGRRGALTLAIPSLLMMGQSRASAREAMVSAHPRDSENRDPPIAQRTFG